MAREAAQIDNLVGPDKEMKREVRSVYGVRAGGGRKIVSPMSHVSFVLPFRWSPFPSSRLGSDKTVTLCVGG
ncbi:hypothetical protein GWI33_010751 [Rhynchophorus ferrugineus]|uniref:Uncharacterized protein n=1 Tax=Rhynchophorus ferrugineus TaxID=354439 RepID=A0A834ISA3_RHYFE|nr:hypothetical protein GWI33_010751 [Rhynchophorus ferrugineus]